MKMAIGLLLSLLLILTIAVGCSSTDSEVTDPGTADPTSNNTQPENDDLSKGFTYTIEDGDLKLTYDNTGNTVTLIQAFEKYDYTVFTNEGNFYNEDQFSKVISAQQAAIEQRIYFTIEPIHGVGITSYFIELDTMEIYFIGQGTFVQEILFDITLTFAVLEDPWSSYLAFYTDANGGGQYYYLGEHLESSIKEQLARAMSGNFDDDDGPLALANLSDGDYVGEGFTIHDINYDDESATFTLDGSMIVTGTAKYDDYSGNLLFVVSETNDLPVLLIHGEPFHINLIHFRNLSDFLDAVPSSLLSELEDEGVTMEVTLRDLQVEFVYYGGGGVSCEFIDLDIR